MLGWLVRESLRLRVAVLALAAALLVLGTRAAGQAPLDVFPEFAPPLVEVQTEAPGLSAEEVESLVTVPLENAVQGVPSVETLRSKSVMGLSSLVLILEPGADLLRERQLVQERLSLARLPAVAAAPVILPPLSSTSRVMKIGISSRQRSREALSELVRWTLRPRLMAVRGVADVSVWGQRDPQLQVLLDPDRLRLHDVTLDQVWTAAAQAASSGGGGFLDTPTQRLGVRLAQPLQGAEDLADVAVAWRGQTPLRLGDVADVRVDHAAPIGEGVVDDEPGLLLIVGKHPWGNTLEVTRGVDAALAALRPALGDDVRIDAAIFRPAGFIERALGNLSEALLIGCGLVVLVLFAFLAQARAALISAVAIPLSLLAAGLALQWLGQTINCMTLAGLVIAVGVVVDDAVIDVENILRRLRLEPPDSGRSPLEVVLAASLEVRGAVVHASLIVVLVCVPVFFLPGLSGAFFRPLGLAYALAILASLVVALTLTPALALLLLPGVARGAPEPRLARALKAGYRRVLPGLIARPRLAVILLACALLPAGLAVPFLGQDLLPEFQESDFLMHWVEKPGTSLEATTRAALLASRELRAIPGVRSFGAHIGRATAGDEVVGPNFAELWIGVEPSADRAATLARVQEVVAGYPGLHRDVLTYLRERVKEVLTGAGASLVVRLYGPELPVLRERAGAIAAALGGVPGLRDLKVESLQLVPQLEVRLRPDALARAGLTPAQVWRPVRALLNGTAVGEVYQGQVVREVALWSEPALRGDPQALRALPLAGADGRRLRLDELADVRVVAAPNEIKREGASRRIDVSMNVSGRDLGSAAREVQDRLASVSLPAGYHPELLGEWAERQRSQRTLLLLAVAALAGIVLIAHQGLGSGRETGAFLLSLPFALAGGVAAVALDGGRLSLGSVVGFVTVLGIAARNGLLLLDHYRHLERDEGLPFGRELLLRGAEERLVPILMTALCAGLALLPIVLRGQIAGHEIERPMAVVILGGLATSTALSLFLTPALYGALRAKEGACAAAS